MIPGIYPPDVRSAAESTATVNRGTNFAVSFTFLTLVCALTRSEAFCRYAGIGLLTITFTLAPHAGQARPQPAADPAPSRRPPVSR